MADQNPDQLDFEAKQERYWSYAPEPTHTVGRIATDYFTLWRDAKGGEYSPYMAGMFLVSHMPRDWVNWAILEEVIVRANDNEPLTDFPHYVLTLLKRWMLNPDHPSSPPDPLAIHVEPMACELMAREPSSPIDITVSRHEPSYPPGFPFPDPPPNLRPIYAPRSPPVLPSAALRVRRAASAPPHPANAPFTTTWELTSHFEMGSSSAHPHSPSASAAKSSPRPAVPPTSPIGYRRTARMSTMSPLDSPFHFSISDLDTNLSDYDYDSEEEPESPLGPFDWELGSGSLTYGSSDSRGMWDTEKECTGHMRDIDWDS